MKKRNRKVKFKYKIRNLIKKIKNLNNIFCDEYACKPPIYLKRHYNRYIKYFKGLQKKCHTMVLLRNLDYTRNTLGMLLMQTTGIIKSYKAIEDNYILVKLH